jgi:UDP-N-acetylmuramate--alanine ligase
LKAQNIKLESDGKYSFEISFANIVDNFRVKLNIYGRHNIDNALLAIQTAMACGIHTSIIKKALENFVGIDRRFQKIKNNVISDYAHHPTEIQTTIDTANNLYKNYLLVFQPHTFSRTKFLYKEFIEVLSKVNNLIIYKTYSARESETDGISGRELANKLGVRYVATKATLKKIVESSKHTVILCGAGDVVSGEFLN